MPPASFLRDVHSAAAAGERGKLRLLRWEAQRLPWADSALVAVQAALAPLEQPPAFSQAIVFSGHRVDEPTRAVPRFPLAMQGRAKNAIAKAIRHIAGGDHARCLGVAGAAAGGDLLFHEACRDLAVASRVFLTLPPAAYLPRSVAASAGDWAPRFHALIAREPVKVLSDELDLPGWLPPDPHYIWGRTNLWMLEEALTLANKVHLMVLWNGAPGDGPGGTGHLVELAHERGLPVTILDTNTLFA